MSVDQVTCSIYNVTGKLKFGLLVWEFSKIHPIILTPYFDLFVFQNGHKFCLTWWKFLSQPPQIGQTIITLNTRHKTSVSVILNSTVLLWGGPFDFRDNLMDDFGKKKTNLYKKIN